MLKVILILADGSIITLACEVYSGMRQQLLSQPVTDMEATFEYEPSARVTKILAKKLV